MGGGYLTEAFPTNFHTFHRQRPLVDNLTADDFKEVTEAEKAKIEAQDAQWVRPSEDLIQRWNIAFGIHGQYNRSTGFFEGNTLKDINTEQAVAILEYGKWGDAAYLTRSTFGDASKNTIIRTTVPSGWEYQNSNPSFIDTHLNGWLPYKLEVIRFSLDDTALVFNKSITFIGSNLREILDKVTPKADNLLFGHDGTSDYHKNLTTIFVYKLAYNLKIPTLLALSLASFRYMVENAANTKAITITVHPDVYSKLNDPENSEWYELNQNAQERQIAFATA